MLISEIITKAALQLVDVNHVRWSRSELLDFLNMGLSTFILTRPDVASTTATFSTVTSKVSLPSNGYTIITVNHVNYRAIQYVDINKLGQIYPDWRTTAGEVTNWTRNEFDNSSIYLYPTPEVSVSIELVYSQNYIMIAETETFPLKNIYESIIFDYIIYRAYDKDSSNPAETQKAQSHLILFKAAIGDKITADQMKEQILKTKEIQR